MPVRKNKRRCEEDRLTCKKTKRRAIHKHNPPGTKMIKKYFKVANGRKPDEEELERLLNDENYSPYSSAP